MDLAAVPLESRPTKRGRYNTHRRDVSLQKPKSTVHRQNQKTRQIGTDVDVQSSEEINDVQFGSVTYLDGLSNDSDDCEQHFQDSGMSLLVSPHSHEQFCSPEDNSDGSLDTNWSDSEGDGSCSSYCESADIQFSGEPESAVSGNDFSQTNESPDKDPYVYPGSQLKLSESVLLILTLAVTHNLNGSCLSDVISLINLHCIPGPQNKCVRSLNALKKYFVDLQLPITKHFYCKFCSEYLGVTGDTPDVCPICGKDVSDLKKEPYFVILSMKNQLRELAQKKEFQEDIKHRFQRKKNAAEDITDVYDGHLYSKLFEGDGPLSQLENFSLKFNTDGVSVFKSSGASVWPVYFQINELPPSKRRHLENMVLGGLWFSDKKPVMSTFLKPFRTSLEELETKGLEMEIPGKGRITSKVYLLGSVLDLPARSSFLEMLQFNGFCSCCYCMILGISCQSSDKDGKRGRVTVFPFNFESSDGLARERTSQSMVADGLQFLKGESGGKPVNGMKGVCQFASLRNFDISKGVCLDYMHGVLLGVTKQLMGLWLDTKYKDKPWYCGDAIGVIDERLCSIQPPLNITRTPRSIETHRKYFKATEYRNWLFHYSIPCLNGVLPDIYLHHFMLLAFGVWLVNQEAICPEDLNLSGNLIGKFVMLFDALYGERHMAMNVHNLLHINASVRNHGPLWAHSAFEFEDANGELTALFHGTQNIDMQIASSMSAVKVTPELARQLEKDSPSYNLYRRMKFGKEQKSTKLENGVHLLGAFSDIKLAQHVENAIIDVSGEESLGWCQMFKRAKIHGEVFHSKSYGRVFRRNSHTVTYEDNQKRIKCGQIMYFLRHTPICQNACVGLCKCHREQYFAVIVNLRLQQDFQLTEVDQIQGIQKQIQVIQRPRDEDIHVAPIRSIIHKCVFMDFMDADYVYAHWRAERGQKEKELQEAETSDRDAIEQQNEQKIRKEREQRLTEEPDSGIKIIIRTHDGKRMQRLFKDTAFFQEVYDWVGSSNNMPLYFTIQRGSTIVMHTDRLQTNEVLDISERVEEEMKVALNNSEVSRARNCDQYIRICD